MAAQLGQSCCPLNSRAHSQEQDIHSITTVEANTLKKKIMEKKTVFNSQQSSIKAVRGKHPMSSRNMGVERGTNTYIFAVSLWIMFSNNCRKAELRICCHHHFPLISMHLFPK